MSNILLTVGIPTLIERKNIFIPRLEKYFNILKLQGLENEVEIITHEDNRELAIGEKRNILLDKAKGKMISFVDDDDDLSGDYFQLIVQKIKQNNNLDAIEIFCFIFHQGNSKFNSYVFKGLTKNFKNKLPNNFIFTPSVHYTHKLLNSKISQLNPIRTDLARRVKYPNIPIHEDFVFAQKLEPLINNVGSILHKSIYTYNYNTTTSSIQEYRKPKTQQLQKLNELFLNKNLLEYDSVTGKVTDHRYYNIIENINY